MSIKVYLFLLNFCNGSLTGYAGGISKKIELLTLEQVDMTNLFVPKKGTTL